MLGHVGDDLMTNDLGREAVAGVAAKAQAVVGQGQMPLLDDRQRRFYFFGWRKNFLRRPGFFGFFHPLDACQEAAAAMA